MQKRFMALAILVAVGCQQKDDNGFVVEGKLEGGAGKTIYLEEAALNSQQPVIIDSAKADKNGNFTVKGTRVEENLYLLRAEGTDMNFARLVNDAARIKVEAKGAVYTVQGSDGSNAILQYTDSLNRTLSRINALDSQRNALLAQGVMDSLLAPVKTNRDSAAAGFRNYTMSVVNGNKSATVSVYALGTYLQLCANPNSGLPQIPGTELVDLLGGVAKRFPAHKGLATLHQRVSADVKQQAAQPQAPSGNTAGLVGKPAPELALNDANGKPVAVSSFRGKWLLVDFWASWCGPCRAENPNVVTAWNNYKTKNFAILGVSLDREKEAWQAAIQKDGLAWTHVSDLAFWDSKAVSTYGFQAIPFNVLIDPAGTVVAVDLRGPDLQAKLGEVLK